MINLKAKLSQDQLDLEFKQDECTSQLTELDSNIKILEAKNQQLEEKLKAQKDISGDKLTADDVLTLITVPDPLQEKILQLVAKHNALDDCMAAVKKGFEREVIPIDEFLKNIRELSQKQCK